MIEAQIICDSISPQGIRLTTMRLRYPKFIHGELMTHRVSSRNASSSRAVPTAKLLEEVRNDATRAAPVWWGKNQPGMQAAEELSGDHLELVMDQWSIAAREAANCAYTMSALGAHKQIVNRLLEPFSHINVVVTATEWDNFFGLRLHRGAQPEMRALAVAMWEARKGSTPELLKPGEWHLPFFRWGMNEDRTNHSEDYLAIKEYSDASAKAGHSLGRWVSAENLTIRVSVARCARVSYMSNDTGKRSTVEEDLKLYDRLMGAQPLHASPAEHQATPDVWVTTDEAIVAYGEGTEPCPLIGWQKPSEHGNLRGWRQFRQMILGQNCAPLPEEYR